jgi:hypothetical protein
VKKSLQHRCLLLIRMGRMQQRPWYALTGGCAAVRGQCVNKPGCK